MCFNVFVVYIVFLSTSRSVKLTKIKGYTKATVNATKSCWSRSLRVLEWYNFGTDQVGSALAEFGMKGAHTLHDIMHYLNWLLQTRSFVYTIHHQYTYIVIHNIMLLIYVLSIYSSTTKSHNHLTYSSSGDQQDDGLHRSESHSVSWPGGLGGLQRGAKKKFFEKMGDGLPRNKQQRYWLILW